MERKTELLAPAGSFDILKAVVNAGADAVYAAGPRFGARAYAQNFTKEELLTAIDFVHLKGKKLYLTVNTLLKEQEMASLYDDLCPLYEAGLDAVIVQDLGVMQMIRDSFSELAVHASTQMTVTGAYGAKLLLEAGCSRIVTARELSLKEISNIYKQTGAEIESFVHGALCYCYSGQCLLSSMIGGRSGNRGRCAQPCRLPYELFDSQRKALSAGKKKGQYLLSPRDLCTIDLIPELIKSGVHSFKIEGRMKQAEYAAGVTGIYRKYIDQYTEDPTRTYQVKGEDRQTLLELGSRCGFTEGYYQKHNGRDMITFMKPSHEKGREELQNHIRNIYVEKENKEKIKGILRLSEGKPTRLVLKCRETQVEVTGELVQTAQKQPLSRETILEKMNKTGNTPFEWEELNLEIEGKIFLSVGALNQLRRAGIEKLAEAMQKPYRRISSTSVHMKEKEQPNRDKFSKTKMRLSVLTETLEQFQEVLKQPEAERVYLEAFALERQQLTQQLKKLVDQAQSAGKECFLALPYVFRIKTAQWYENHWSKIEKAGVDGYLIRNLEELSFLREQGVEPIKIQGDYGLYGYSNQGIYGLHKLSLEYFTLPVELNAKELRALDCAKGELIVYGYQPLMLSAQCLYKNTAGCDKKAQIFYLKDRYGKLFPVKNHCEDCYNILYNISPLSLFHQFSEIRTLAPAAVRISFTLENQKQVEQIFELYRQAAATDTVDRDNYLSDFTNGHLKRGVE